MSRATPQMRSVAKHLLENHVVETGAAEPADKAMFPVIDKLRPHLAVLMGIGGVRALLARALVLSSAEIAWLAEAQVSSDCDLQGLESFAAELDPADFFEGRVVLLAQLLGLLVAFIGPSLTSRLIGEVWPQIPLNERDFGKENDREKGS